VHVAALRPRVAARTAD